MKPLKKEIFEKVWQITRAKSKFYLRLQQRINL